MHGAGGGGIVTPECGGETFERDHHRARARGGAVLDDPLIVPVEELAQQIDLIRERVRFQERRQLVRDRQRDVRGLPFGPRERAGQGRQSIEPAQIALGGQALVEPRHGRAIEITAIAVETEMRLSATTPSTPAW